MNYNQTLEFLFSSLVSYQEKGPEAYKPGLERITAFCKHLGNPQRNYFTIHVAGTNGKGSVSHMLASVLQQAGYRTGLYTSPHLRDFRERILVDGEMIPKQKVVNFVDKHYDCMKELGLSFFEMSTALAFDYFDQSDVEVAVIETGLGGRLDATNLIIPIVSVITNIGLDHMALLGDTLPKIAAEKAGIIKKSIPVVIGEKSDEYNHVFDQAATAMMSKIVYAENDFACINHSTEGDFQKFSIQRHRDNKVFNLELDLTGNYQVHNILTAIAVIDLLHQETPLTISLRALTEGMRTVASGTALQGRWQKLGDKPLTICDTGHNAHGIRYVAEQLAATGRALLLLQEGRQERVAVFSASHAGTNDQGPALVETLPQVVGEPGGPIPVPGIAQGQGHDLGPAHAHLVLSGSGHGCRDQTGTGTQCPSGCQMPGTAHAGTTSHDEDMSVGILIARSCHGRKQGKGMAVQKTEGTGAFFPDSGRHGDGAHMAFPGVGHEGD